MKTLVLRQDVVKAMELDHWLKTGRLGLSGPIIEDQEVIERLELLSLPGEDLNDTILRLIRQGGARPQ